MFLTAATWRLTDSPVDYGVDDDTRVRLICRQDVFHLCSENKYSLLHCRMLEIFLTSMSYISLSHQPAW